MDILVTENLKKYYEMGEVRVKALLALIPLCPLAGVPTLAQFRDAECT